MLAILPAFTVEALRIPVCLYDNLVYILTEYINYYMDYFNTTGALLVSLCRKYTEEGIIGFGF